MYLSPHFAVTGKFPTSTFLFTSYSIHILSPRRYVVFRIYRGLPGTPASSKHFLVIGKRRELIESNEFTSNFSN